MGAVNFKNITAAVVTLVKAACPTYEVKRNAVRPQVPFASAFKTAWVGVYRDSLTYQGRTIGGSPYLVKIALVVEVQVASVKSEEDAEDRLCTAEAAVLAALDADKKLGNTVDMVSGYVVNYDFNQNDKTYYQSALINLEAEVRA
jgi:hypothetical protein